MTKIQAAILDIDGTLLDTREFISQAYEHVLQSHGMPKRSRDEIASQIGKKLNECYAFLAPEGNHNRMMEDHHNFQEANLALVTAFDHVEFMIERLKLARIKTALWTGRKGNVVASLEQARVEPDAFDCIVDANMYEKSKPNPEGLYKVLEVLGVKPEFAVMIGDAGVDVEAGRRAGVRATIGITHGFGTREELELAEADYIVDSLEAIPAIIEGIK